MIYVRRLFSLNSSESLFYSNDGFSVLGKIINRKMFPFNVEPFDSVIKAKAPKLVNLIMKRSGLWGNINSG